MRPLSSESVWASYARTPLLRPAEVSKPVSTVQQGKQEDCGGASQTDGTRSEDHGAGTGQEERPVCVLAVPFGHFLHGRGIPAKTYRSGLALLRASDILWLVSLIVDDLFLAGFPYVHQRPGQDIRMAFGRGNGDGRDALGW